MQLQDTLLDNCPTCNKIFETRKGATMENKNSDDKPKESKINQNILIAIIGSITTIAVAVVPFLLNRANSQTPPTPVPLVITATTIPDFSTETLAPKDTLTPTPTIELPTATATQQVGVFNIKLATNIAGLNPTTQFKPADSIYLIFDINDPLNQNIVKIRWSAVNVNGVLKDFEKSSSLYTVKDNHFAKAFDHSANPWKAGRYKVEVSMNGVTETIEFDIVP